MSDLSYCPGREEYGCEPSVAMPAIRWMMPSDAHEEFATFDGGDVAVPHDKIKPAPVWQWVCGCWRVVRSGDYPAKLADDEDDRLRATSETREP